MAGGLMQARSHGVGKAAAKAWNKRDQCIQNSKNFIMWKNLSLVAVVHVVHKCIVSCTGSIPSHPLGKWNLFCTDDNKQNKEKPKTFINTCAKRQQKLETNLVWFFYQTSFCTPLIAFPLPFPYDVLPNSSIHCHTHIGKVHQNSLTTSLFASFCLAEVLRISWPLAPSYLPLSLCLSC